MWLICEFPDAPQIVPFSWPHGIETGNPFVAVTCVARGSGPLLFRWMKDGNELKTSERSLVRQTDKHSTLGISNLEIGDRGNYSCLVSNSAGSDSFTAALNVKRKIHHVNICVSQLILRSLQNRPSSFTSQSMYRSASVPNFLSHVVLLDIQNLPSHGHHSTPKLSLLWMEFWSSIVQIHQ